MLFGKIQSSMIRLKSSSKLSIPAVCLEHGVHKDWIGNTIRAGRPKPGVLEFDVYMDMDNKFTKPVSHVSEAEIKSVLDKVEEFSFAPSSYDDAKSDPNFEKLYGIEEYQFKAKKNGLVVDEPLKGTYCMECGVLLPVKCLEIDHQKAKVGGHNEAIQKVFRTFGLAAEGPQGPKGMSLFNAFTTGASVKAAIPKYGRTLGGTDENLRYQMNYTGMVIYSLLVNAGALTELRLACMHNIVNLRPCCRPCNSSKSNSLKYGADGWTPPKKANAMDVD